MHTCCAAVQTAGKQQLQLLTHKNHIGTALMREAVPSNALSLYRVVLVSNMA